LVSVRTNDSTTFWPWNDRSRHAASSKAEDTQEETLVLNYSLQFLFIYLFWEWVGEVGSEEAGDPGNQGQCLQGWWTSVNMKQEQMVLINSFLCSIETYYNTLESSTKIRSPIRGINLLIKLLRSPVIIGAPYYPFCLFILIITLYGNFNLWGTRVHSKNSLLISGNLSGTWVEMVADKIFACILQGRHQIWEERVLSLDPHTMQN
jgi:hypothetical protein